jgi:hypothetical protein
MTINQHKDVLTLEQVNLRKKQGTWPLFTGTDENFFPTTGWFGGGYAGPARVSTIDRLNFSAETLAVSPATLSIARNSLAATSGNGFGWFGGGATPARVSTIDRLNFSAETLAVSPATLSSERGYLAATSGNGFGWFGGGFVSPARVSTIDRLNFSAETRTVSPATLSIARNSLAATAGGIS